MEYSFLTDRPEGSRIPDRTTQKRGITVEENNKKNAQEDPRPLTDEEFASFQKKQKRESGIIKDIIDFILGFFQ